jgi:8-oxo-dGTP pyrophosphatase MutT (NUDIX family)
MNWKELSNKTVYENPWIRVSESEVLDPKGEKAVYGKVHYKKITVGIIPIFSGNKTILIGQHRFPTKSYSWEIPMGGAENGETPLRAAKRELLEETGIVGEDWIELLNLETSNSVTDEKVVVYYCKVKLFEESNPENTELLKIQKLGFNEIVNKIEDGEIVDAISVASILRMKLIIDKRVKNKSRTDNKR